MGETARQIRLGKQVKLLREQRSMTQEDLAGRVAFSSGAVIAAIEAGEKTPSLWKALDIAIQLGVSLSELVGEHAPAASVITNNANGDHQTVYQHVVSGVVPKDVEDTLAGIVAQTLAAVLEHQRPLLVTALTAVMRGTSEDGQGH